ncbi:MAG: YesL family protein [Lachnospiraceae bacterium]|nr:YesL family protein [Lachnospiraceae bacterium]
MQYNSPFVKFLEAIANMFIVSFFWLIFCLPVVTIIPASAALYYTVVEVIFGDGRGNGVVKGFWESFKENVKAGIPLSLVTVVALAFIAEGLWTGYQLFRVSIWGMLYFILGILITLVVVPAIIYVPIVLSKFEAPFSVIVKVAAYFAMKNPIISILNVLLLGVMVLLVDIFPLSLLITPALYADLLRPSVEKRIGKFIEETTTQSASEEGENA